MSEAEAEAEAAATAGFDAGWYPVALGAFFAMTALMFVTVNIWIAAPYGRHAQCGWSFGVAVQESWIIMESPVLFVMALVYHTGQFHLLHVPHVLLRLHQLHYIHRTLIYPFRMRAEGKAVPVSVVVVGFCFNVFNSYLQARWISHYGTYPGLWLSTPQFLLGAVRFLGGFAGNIWADNVLLNLRSDKEDRSYKIPRGILYKAWMSLQQHGEHLKLKRHISKAVNFPGALKCRLGLTELGDQSLALGFMSRVDKNTWNGLSRRSLEAEIVNKRYLLHNMHDLDLGCKKAGVQLLSDVCVGRLGSLSKQYSMASKHDQHFHKLAIHGFRYAIL